MSTSHTLKKTTVDVNLVENWTEKQDAFIHEIRDIYFYEEEVDYWKTYRNYDILYFFRQSSRFNSSAII